MARKTRRNSGYARKPARMARRRIATRRAIRGPWSPWDGRLPVTVTVNGTAHVRSVEPRMLLVDFLRDELRLTGTHVGCDTSHCGACTILLDGHAVKSCTMFAVQADGTELTTIEGLAPHGRLDPVQEAFKQHHGLQCGFCTPGVVLAAKELLNRSRRPTKEEIRVGISGNLCRCTGYVNIVKAVAAAAESAGGA